MSLPSVNHLHLMESMKSPDKILKLMVTMTRLKGKSRSHNDVAHVQPITNIPTSINFIQTCGFQDIAKTRFYRSRSLRQGQRSNQYHSRPASPALPFSHNKIAPQWTTDLCRQNTYGPLQATTYPVVFDGKCGEGSHLMQVTNGNSIISTKFSESSFHGRIKFTGVSK